MIIGASLSEPHLVTTAERCLFIAIYIYRTSSCDQLLNTYTVYAVLVPRTNLSFPGLYLRDRDATSGDCSRVWYGLPGRSVERSQASGSDKLAGGSKHM